jgi:diaminopimelate epimerase
MIDVDTVVVDPDGSCVLDTGVPHCVKFVCDINKVDVVSEGRKVRNSERFRERGVNVDFVSTEEVAHVHLTEGSDTENNVTQNDVSHGRIRVLTYERGVEDETFSCGTGVTASAIAFFFCKKMQKGTLSLNERGVSIAVSTRGGGLSVTFDVVDNSFINIFLGGPAEFVFEGRIQI